ncbi:MAG: TIGR02569 family protein [Pseudonocardia sp.]
MSSATGERPASAVGDGAELPAHVRTAFGVREAEVVPIKYGGLPGFRCDDVVIRPVSDNAVAAWAARVLDSLRADRVRIARPLRSSDGRWVVAGWSACQYLRGQPADRYDDLVAVSLRLHAATASVRRPRLLDDRDDLVARADGAAWGERTVTLDADTGGRLFDELAARRRPLKLPCQVVHGDLFGTVLFDGPASGTAESSAIPAVVDLVPFWRPVEWAAAVVVVDALAWGGGDRSLVRTWSHLDGWPQALLRALMFRVALHAQHPAATPDTLRGLEHAAELVLSRL